METANNKVQFSEIRHLGKLSRDGVFIYHLGEKRIEYLNKSMERILEVNKKVIMEDPDLLLQQLGEEERDYLEIRFRELKDKGRLEDVQTRFKQNQVEKTLSISCYLSSNGSSVIGFVKDITKPKEHEDYLINFGAKKDALLDAVSQTLATPLNLSQFTVDLIEKAVQERKFHKLNAHLALMREVTAECIRIIDNFMREEHLESPDIHTKANRFDLVAKVLVVLDQLKAANPDKKMKLKSSVKNLLVTGDDLKFFQIIHNLISNAVKFTGPKGEIEVIVTNQKNSVEVIVRDNGIGIPEKLQPFLFQKESRAARPGLKGEASSGIGLYVVKKLTELMKGKISVESKEGTGTSFRLELPKK